MTNEKKPIKFYLDELKNLQRRMQMVGKKNKYDFKAFVDAFLKNDTSNPFNL